MGRMVELLAADGHAFAAYRAGSPGAVAGLVVLQEIFGVNAHIRAVCDRFAEAGFAAIAPSLFDRVERDVELGYAPEDTQTGVAIRSKVPEAGALLDIEAAAIALGLPKCGVIGYCWGGTMAWLSASRSTRFAAAVSWYGTAIAKHKDIQLNIPVQLHFGATDDHIPPADVDAIRTAHPEVELHVYDGAGHGFGCDPRESFDPDAYAKARERSLAFLHAHLDGRAG
jgi:carboxymethylenebutenolidase